MATIKIVGILIKDRIKESGRTQHVLSEFSHIIQTRMGFHEVSEAICSRVGVIILHLVGEPSEWHKFEEQLSEIGGIEVQFMQFDN